MHLANHCAVFPGLSLLNTRAVSLRKRVTRKRVDTRGGFAVPRHFKELGDSYITSFTSILCSRLFLNPENGGEIFLLKFGCLLRDCISIYPISQDPLRTCLILLRRDAQEMGRPKSLMTYWLDAIG
jgi:hypothetical protein